jgi:hypothetical protein
MLLPSGPTPERGLAAVGWFPLPAKRRHTRAADCQLALQSALLAAHLCQYGPGSRAEM